MRQYLDLCLNGSSGPSTSAAAGRLAPVISRPQQSNAHRWVPLFLAALVAALVTIALRYTRSGTSAGPVQSLATEGAAPRRCQPAFCSRRSAIRRLRSEAEPRLRLGVNFCRYAVEL